MLLSNFRILAKGYIPGAKSQVITTDVLDLIINNGVLDVATYSCCLKANKKFTVTAEQQEYVLSTVLGDYLTPDKPGLWWSNGTDFKQLNPRTLHWLDKNRPNWRSLTSASPQDYTIDGDVLTIIPKPDTTLSQGFWFYYGKKPTPMTQGEHYPFTGSSVELTHLSIFDEAILQFVSWKVNPILSKDNLVDITEQAYKRELANKILLFKARPDIANSTDARMRGTSQRE